MVEEKEMRAYYDWLEFIDYSRSLGTLTDELRVRHINAINKMNRHCYVARIKWK